MEKISIIDHLQNEYKFEFTDDQKKDLLHFIETADLDIDRMQFKTIGSFASFKNAATQDQTYKTSHRTPLFDFDRVIWALVPQRFPINCSVSIKDGDRYKEYQDEYEGSMDDIANIIFVKRVEYNEILKAFIDTYFCYIYNPALEMVADGIRFV